MVLVQQEFNMETVSPVLPEGIKNYLIDIDGTITEDVPNEEPWRMLDWENLVVVTTIGLITILFAQQDIMESGHHLQQLKQILKFLKNDYSRF